MQSASSLSHAVFRIVFRGGSPQRIQYSDRLHVTAVLAFVVLGALSQWLFYRATVIEVGLFLFTCLPGIYIGSALLTRRVPRSRLRNSLLALFLLLAASQLLLVLLAPLRDLAWAPVAITAGVTVAVLLGSTNVLRFALASSRLKAAMIAVGTACALAAFYLLLRSLLSAVFS